MFRLGRGGSSCCNGCHQFSFQWHAFLIALFVELLFKTLGKCLHHFLSTVLWIMVPATVRTDGIIHEKLFPAGEARSAQRPLTLAKLRPGHRHSPTGTANTLSRLFDMKLAVKDQCGSGATGATMNFSTEGMSLVDLIVWVATLRAAQAGEFELHQPSQRGSRFLTVADSGVSMFQPFSIINSCIRAMADRCWFR